MADNFAARAAAAGERVNTLIANIRRRGRSVDIEALRDEAVRFTLARLIMDGRLDQHEVLAIANEWQAERLNEEYQAICTGRKQQAEINGLVRELYQGAGNGRTRDLR